MNTTTLETPLGRLTLAASDAGVTRCTLRTVTPAAAGTEAARGWLDLARRELDAYFAGELREFTVPVDLDRVGQPHRRILEALGTVGYGRTTTYGALATELGLVSDGPAGAGSPGAGSPGDGPRTVGGAMARNPVWIIVPCHRVLGAGGRLTGYAGGLPAKRRLLELEAQPTRAQLTLAW